MLFTTRVGVKHFAIDCCIKFHHTSLRSCSKRPLVPEQFLSLAEKTRFSNTSSKKVGKTNHKGRYEKDGKRLREYLYGISPCLAALEANRRTFYTIYFNDESLNAKSRPQFKKIKFLSTTRNIATKSVSRKRLDDLCGSRPHQFLQLSSKSFRILQNIVMKVGNLSLVPLQDHESESIIVDGNRPSLWLILQGIQDPMNMGAILRTAVFLGVDKVVSSETDSCSLTPAVSKASAGAMEALPVYTTNIRHLLKKKREENYEILGTVGPRFVAQGSSSPVIRSGELKLEKPALLVLGNEGKGLSSEIQSLCTKFLTISPQQKKMNELDSLNVSVAAGIILHSLLSNIDR